MKNLFTTVICLMLTIGLLSAQTPNAFKYQAVVRDNAGQVLANKTVGFRISILQTSAAGSVIYSEKHTAQTNAFGLVNLEIGNGTIVSGAFSGIDWGSDSYFVKIELDDNNDGLFAEMGTSQLLSVPVALYAKIAGNGFSGSWFDLTNKPILFSGNYSDLTNKPDFAKVATSGKYVDLLDKPNFAAIATSGSFIDLLDKPNFVTTTSALQTGDVLFYNGTAWQVLQKGVNGQTLRLDQGLPKWGEPGYALPMVTTNPAIDVLQTGATSGGNVIATGYSDILGRGVCWSTIQNPTIADGKTTEPVGIGTFTSKLTDLIANTTYYVRAYATNAAGTAYGNQVSFKTFLTVVFPTVTTLAATNLTENSVASGGNVTVTGGAEVIAKGICWSTNQTPTIADNKTNDGTGVGQYNSQLVNLDPGTTYYIRAYATNSAGTGYGSQVSSTTVKTLPKVTTKNITELSSMGGVTGGNIISSGGGTISERGICWGESQNPTVLDNKEISPSAQSSFSLAIIKATKPNTMYYVRAYAKSELGVGYGEQKSFTTADAQYYTSFENGLIPTGWVGPWTVTNTLAFDGSYSLKSLTALDCEVTFTLTLSTAGRVIFYYGFNGGSSIDFLIDNVLVTRFNNDGSGWRQAVAEVSAGTRVFKWKFNRYCFASCSGTGYIDHITITK